jgi:hypothetical protein
MTPRMLRCALGLALAACGGPQAAPRPPGNGGGSGSAGGGSGDPPGVVQDTRTEIERRRDAACDKLGPKLARCAVEDSHAMFAAGKITKQQHDDATKPELERGLDKDWRTKCRRGYLSSRQVRVLEVCFREETECAPLEACLGHLKSSAK